MADFAGYSNSVDVAQGIAYAVEMGARVINVSIAGRELTRIEQAAVDEAVKAGALVVVAAGNEAVDTQDISPASLKGVITVTASGIDDARAKFSNWGQAVDITAPGSDILSLRARWTDLVHYFDPEYETGANIVGEHGLYYRTSGTSFAAPYVSGVASLLLSVNPDLTAEQVKRMILHSARDIGLPGRDQYTGYGLLDAGGAMQADPEFFVEASITDVQVVEKKGKAYVQVLGTADANKLKRAWIEIGAGDEPKKWKKVAGAIKKPVKLGVLGEIEGKHFQGASKWTLRVISEHKKGRKREGRYVINLG